MNIYTVSLFGHREIESLRELENRLVPIITELLRTKSYVSFLIGRNGEFDEFAASVIKSVRKRLGFENCDLTLVLPYEVSGISDYEKYYDGILIPDMMYGIYPRAAITFRNRWMIERSDLVITYVERAKGGAYTASKYAERLGKRVINLCNLSFDD